MTDPFGLMKFAECEHKQLKCEKCGARSDIRGWSTFTGQNKEMMDLREANESLTARLAEAEESNSQQALTIEGQGNRISQLKERLAEVEADIEIYKRREETHRKVQKMPCLRCGYQPHVVTLAENGGHEGSDCCVRMGATNRRARDVP